MHVIRKSLMLSMLAALLIALAACSSGEENTENNEDAENTQEEQEEPKEPAAELESDADLQEQLQAEEEVEEAMVQVVDDQGEQSVNIDIMIGADQEWNEEWLSKYQEMIREKYSDQPVDLIVAQDGSLITQETIE